MKRLCKRGHDTSVTGRNAQGACVPCKKMIDKNYRKVNKQELIEYKKQYYQENKEDLLEQKKQYCKDNSDKIALHNIKNATNRNLRIPKFGQDGIVEFYRNCPDEMVVDHIIPLRGKLVSGLHVRWNLQYLTSNENNRKYNSCNLLEISKKNNAYS